LLEKGMCEGGRGEGGNGAITPKALAFRSDHSLALSLTGNVARLGQLRTQFNQTCLNYVKPRRHAQLLLLFPRRKKKTQGKSIKLHMHLYI